MFDPVAEIKSRIPIEELVGSYVQLKRMGRQFKALCPFHNERSPSFYVSPEKQLAYCFGCRKGGDHFAFVQEIEGMNFPEALEFLAARAGIDLPKNSPAFHAVPKSEKDTLYDIHRTATDFFEQQLWETPEGNKIRDYFLERGLTEATIKSWRLGFAPDGGAVLYTHLLQSNYKKEDIIRSGLVVTRDATGNECIDRFRLRAMFPIRSYQGSVCGFGGRVVRAGDEPKYLNSPETPIYHKSNVLFGYAEAKNDIRTHKHVIVVEGYMDVIGLHQAGVTNVVASSGTALTRDQLKVLKRIASLVYFAFDQDSAGKHATERALSEARQEDVMVKVINWPLSAEAKDPDELVRKNPTAFHDAIAQAHSGQHFLLQFALELHGTQSPLEKKNVLEQVLPALLETQNALDRDQWVKEIALALSIGPNVVYDELKRFSGKQRRPASATQSSSTPIIEHKLMNKEEYFIMLLLTKPQITAQINAIVEPNVIENEDLRALYMELISQYNQSPRPPEDLLNAHPEREAVRNVLELSAERMCDELTPEEIEGQLHEVISYLLRQHFERRKRAFLTRLQAAPKEEHAQLLTEYETLLAQGAQAQQYLWQKS
ncbi:DNA primase [Candidatus Gracilibacteria bacterium]|nr:DNA primase [Candidatus Gracilibacteria bacterium]